MTNNPYWPVIKVVAGLLLACVLLGAVYLSGYQRAQSAAALDMAKVVSDNRQAALAAEQAYTAKLEQAAAERLKWYDFAQEQSAKLAAANRRIDAQADRLQKEIADVVKQDKSRAGGCVDGLGTDGLQLYRHALGYPG